MGQFPSVEHQFKPGQSGNPEGRKTAGAYVIEWFNSFACQGLPEDELRKIARDKKESWTRRAAAEQVIRMMESGDIADFQDLINGKIELKELRQDGVNTEVIKKFKQKSRVVPVGDGETEEVIEREIELHDRTGPAFDRVVEHSAGKPNQAIQVQGEIGLPVPVIIVQLAHPSIAKQLEAEQPKLPEG